MSTFDIFIDYTCPWVAQIYPWIVDVLNKDKSLKVNWRSFPLEQINNELDDWKCWNQDENYISRGLWALRGGIAARMIGDNFHNQYMAKILDEKHVKRTDIRSRQAIIDIAQKLSFPDEFTIFLDDATRLEEISKDYSYAYSLGVFGTPTFLFDDTHLAFLKTFTPPNSDSISFFNNFYQMAALKNYFGELKRPQPPWPRHAKD